VMMRRIKAGVFALVLLTLTIGMCSAAVVITANPTNIVVPVGGTTSVTATVSDSAATGSYSISVNTQNPAISASISGPYLDPTFTTSIPGVTTTTPFGKIESINWNGQAGTTYYFKVTFTASTPGQTFTAVLTAGTTSSSTPLSILGVSVSGTVTPELLTLALVGAGAVAVVLLRRRGL